MRKIQGIGLGVPSILPRLMDFIDRKFGLHLQISTDSLLEYDYPIQSQSMSTCGKGSGGPSTFVTLAYWEDTTLNVAGSRPSMCSILRSTITN